MMTNELLDKNLKIKLIEYISDKYSKENLPNNPRFAETLLKNRDKYIKGINDIDYIALDKIIDMLDKDNLTEIRDRLSGYVNNKSVLLSDDLKQELIEFLNEYIPENKRGDESSLVYKTYNNYMNNLESSNRGTIKIFVDIINNNISYYQEKSRGDSDLTEKVRKWKKINTSLKKIIEEN